MAELARIETVVFLQSVDVFSACKAEEVLRIAAIAREQSFRQGEEIFSAGDTAESLFCVVRGQIRLATPEQTVMAGPLQTIGAVELLTGGRRATSAAADSDTLVLVIEADDFFDLLAHNIEIVRALFQRLLPQRADGQ